MDDNDGVGALESVQGDSLPGAMVRDDDVACAQVERGYGSHTVSHDGTWLPVTALLVESSPSSVQNRLELDANQEW